MYRRLSLPPPHVALLRRLSHSLFPSPSHQLDDDLSNPCLGFVRKELEDLHSLVPRLSSLRPEEGNRRRSGREVVEISHPWPEWVQLMELLMKNGYLDRTALKGNNSSSSSLSAAKDSNHIRSACLNFARDRYDIIRYLSRRDIQILVKGGCPCIDRKVVNSGKRLRAHVGIQEGDVCSSCSFRGTCERAYVKAREDEVGRTVDVMRILLTYGLDIITGSVENPACINKIVKESVKRLLNELVEFSLKEFDPNTLMVTPTSPLPSLKKSNRNQMFKGQIAVPMKQGDWICPKCNFLNFAKNIKCLQCNGKFEERFSKLREDLEHLPLKKGDWICEKCNFFNFAKNCKCLQCHEKPSKRQLNPGEWECVSCNYINFRKNMVCLKCDWKRPKAVNNGEFTGLKHDSQGYCNNNSTSFVRDNNTNRHKFVTEEDSDFWSSREDDIVDDDNDDKIGALKNSSMFDKFPIIGGKSAVSQDPRAREKWKEKMSNRSKGFVKETLEEDDRVFPSFSSDTCMELDESNSEDDLAEWFGGGGKANRNLAKFNDQIA